MHKTGLDLPYCMNWTPEKSWFISDIAVEYLFSRCKDSRNPQLWNLSGSSYTLLATM